MFVKAMELDCSMNDASASSSTFPLEIDVATRKIASRIGGDSSIFVMILEGMQHYVAVRKTRTI